MLTKVFKSASPRTTLAAGSGSVVLHPPSRSVTSAQAFVNHRLARMLLYAHGLFDASVLRSWSM